MATLTKGKTFTNGETVTPQKLHELVDLGTVSGIVNADISAGAAIADSKLAQITTAGKVLPAAVQGTAVVTADPRLSDARVPVPHTHAISDTTGLQTALDGKQASGSYAAASHTHDDRYYTETEMNTLLAGKQAAGSYAPATGIAPSAITGTAVITTDSRLSDARTPVSHTHDDRYYTEAEIDTKLSGLPVSGHTHDDRYYTETEMNTLLAGKQASGSYAPSTGIAPSAITGTAVITTDSRLSDARTPVSHTHSASEITSGNFANARTTATNANTASAIVARDSFGDFVANRITSSQTIPKAGSLRFNDTFGTEVEITGDSVDDKLFIKAGGSTIIEIDNTSGFPIFKINTGISSAFRVSIGGSSPPACAKLEIASTTQGFLLPRMTTSQRNAISMPVAGLMIYNTTTEKVETFGGINYPQYWY